MRRPHGPDDHGVSEEVETFRCELVSPRPSQRTLARWVELATMVAYSTCHRHWTWSVARLFDVRPDHVEHVAPRRRRGVNHVGLRAP